MTKIGEKQIRRAERIAKDGHFSKVLPMILTMRDESLFILDSGVPVVPIRRLADFILNWDQSSEILVLEAGERQQVISCSG